MKSYEQILEEELRAIAREEAIRITRADPVEPTIHSKPELVDEPKKQRVNKYPRRRNVLTFDELVEEIRKQRILTPGVKQVILARLIRERTDRGFSNNIWPVAWRKANHSLYIGSLHLLQKTNVAKSEEANG